MDETTVVCELPVLRWGVGNGRSALLVHGVAASGAGWSRLAVELAAAGYAVHAPDLRGHGAAPAAGSYRFEDFAADLARLGPAWDVVVGHSLGGPIAAALVRAGLRVGRLVLLDPVFEIADDELEAVIADQMTEADAFADPVSLARANPRWHPEDAFHKASAARQVGAHTVERVFRDNAPWHHAELAVGLGVPVTVLGGDPTVFAMFTPELAQRLRALDPSIAYDAVAGAGHGVQRERLDAVVAAVLAGGR